MLSRLVLFHVEGYIGPMRYAHDLTVHSMARLERQDLIAFEPFLREGLATFLKFDAASVAFPMEGPESYEPALYLPDEQRLLIPLRLRDRFLGLFIVRGVKLSAPQTTTRALPGIMELILDRLHIYKQAVSDAQTGLMSRAAFLDCLVNEIETIRNSIHPGGQAQEPLSEWRASVGVIYLDMPGLITIPNRYGPLLVDRLLESMATELLHLLPERGMAGRVADQAMAVLVPEIGIRTLRELGKTLASRLSSLVVEHKLTEEPIRLSVPAGFILYPQDMDGPTLELNSADQARRLLLRAQEAAGTAMALKLPSFGFGQILNEGGRVLDVLPLDRAMISPGRRAGAREGQRFQAFGPESPAAKAELHLLEVEEDRSLAEVLHLADPAYPLAPGDRLSLLPETGLTNALLGDAGCRPTDKDAAGLYAYRDFLDYLRSITSAREVFTLALLRLPAGGEAPPPAEAERLLQEAAALAAETLGSETVLGRFSLHGLICFSPDLGAEAAKERYVELVGRISGKLDVEAAAGLYCHPCLSFRRDEALENCRKALDYALLLPAPHVGVLDSLALTISADRSFANGDLYGAMEEYKLALLADDGNALARTSMAVALARLGRLPEARSELELVVERDRRNLQAWYNLGHVLHRQGDEAGARVAFQRCQKIEPGHVYSLLRLGQLSEDVGRLVQAGHYYERAQGRSAEGERLARRHLARLRLRQGFYDEARDHLHRALIHNPQDAASLNLLAGIYLDQGEDPQIAESLARKSVALRPEIKAYWETLARALDAVGKTDEAREARARAR